MTDHGIPGEKRGFAWLKNFDVFPKTLDDAKEVLLYSRDRSLSLKLSDTRVYEPQIRARLGATTHFCGSGCVLPSLWKWLRPPFSVSPDPAPLTRQTCTRSPASSVASLLRPAQRRLPRLLSFCDASAQPGIPSSSSSLLSLQVLEGP